MYNATAKIKMTSMMPITIAPTTAPFTEGFDVVFVTLDDTGVLDERSEMKTKTTSARAHTSVSENFSEVVLNYNVLHKQKPIY
jgi:hypothetical protein